MECLEYEELKSWAFPESDRDEMVGLPCFDELDLLVFAFECMVAVDCEARGRPFSGYRSCKRLGT